MSETYINLLIAYKTKIENIIEKDPTNPISIEIQKETKSINEFIESYETLEKNKKKFDRYTQGLVLSISPQTKSLLFNLEDISNSTLYM